MRMTKSAASLVIKPARAAKDAAILLLGLLSTFSPSFGPLVPESLVPGENEGGGIVTCDL